MELEQNVKDDAYKFMIHEKDIQNLFSIAKENTGPNGASDHLEHYRKWHKKIKFQLISP